ncbi:ABC transporter permease [Pengzhenrongella sp.]|jgi:peptide/nickel transport system permease protein|uniref:ABC transporter permease n=1 Tax=Pengzhenrongella sp. TaxID=2888820 RepID=UPI002F947063
MTQLATRVPARPAASRPADDAAVTPAGQLRTRRRLLDAAAAIARRPALVLAAVWLLAVVLAAIAPTVLAGGDPLAGVPADKLAPPSPGHLFGTDQLGRDLLTRVVHGTGLTLRGAVVAVALGLTLGSLVGLVSGSAGGRVDDVIMRGVDVLLAIPSLLLSLAIITALGFGTVNVAIAVGLASVASIARVMRSEVLRVRGSAYVEAAHAYGGRPLSVLLRHVLPNAAGPVVALAALELGTAILAISSLSFLGFGEPPPAPEWGALVAGGRDYLATAWWLTTLPGVTIALSVLAANHVARALDGGRESDR